MTAGARLLIVEDEPALMRGLTDTLRGKGYTVLAATDGERGLELALAERPDLVLLDVMLPRMNGYEVCREIRRHGFDMPVLMLTAKGQEADIVLGLNLGADDYITKPFRLAELLARVSAFLRRRLPVAGPRKLGGCIVDLDARTVERHGRTERLTTKEARLLAFFLERPGRALSRDVILDAVWGSSVFVTPRSIDRCVTTLRAKLEADPRNPAYIVTLRDVGYRFEPGDGSAGDSSDRTRPRVR